MHSFDPIQLSRDAWNLAKDNKWHINKLLLLMVVASLPDSIFGFFAESMQLSGGWVDLTALVLYVLSLGLSYSLMLGMYNALIAFVDGGVVPQVDKNLLAPIRFVLRLIGVFMLSGIVAIAGFVLLIIPGIYVMCRLSLAYILVSQGYTVMGALYGSWEATRGQVWNIIKASWKPAGYIFLVALGALSLFALCLFALGHLTDVVLAVCGAISILLYCGAIVWIAPRGQIIGIKIYLALEPNIPAVYRPGYVKKVTQ